MVGLLATTPPSTKRPRSPLPLESIDQCSLPWGGFRGALTDIVCAAQQVMQERPLSKITLD